MKAVYKRRLLKAAEIVEKLPKDKFDMSEFFHDCGSPACVLGHYAVATKFRSIRKDTDACRVFGTLILNDAAGDAEKHFDIDYLEYCELFDATGCGNAKTGKQAAKYIRNFVKRKYG